MPQDLGFRKMSSCIAANHVIYETPMKGMHESPRFQGRICLIGNLCHIRSGYYHTASSHRVYMLYVVSPVQLYGQVRVNHDLICNASKHNTKCNVISATAFWLNRTPKNNMQWNTSVPRSSWLPNRLLLNEKQAFKVAFPRLLLSEVIQEMLWIYAHHANHIQSTNLQF